MTLTESQTTYTTCTQYCHSTFDTLNEFKLFTFVTIESNMPCKHIKPKMKKKRREKKNKIKIDT